MAQQTALISGITGNLGQAVADYFFSKSWQITGTSHKPISQNQFDVVAVDVTDEKAAGQYVERSIQKFGTIDTAILTVGGFAMGNLANTDNATIEKFIKLNFESAYNLARPLLAHMSSRHKGSLFFIGSGQGLDTNTGKEVVAYSLSKSLLFQLANIINAEKNKTGVQAFVVVPSIIDTIQNREAMPDADFSKWQKPAAIAGVIEKYALNSKPEKNIIILKEELQ